MRIAISTKNLTKDFNGHKAVDHLNLSVPEGSVYGFLGPNGAGKTTTLKMLTGMIEATSGEIEIFGEKVVFGNNHIAHNIGFLPDVPGFYDWMTAKEFLVFSGSLYKINQQELDKRTSELLDLVGLKKSSNKKIGKFSRGMKQRLGIAQALINNPKIIFLDEPVSALDPVGRKEVIDIISSLAGKVTVFFSTHILADVEKICDRIIIIKEGKVILEDSMENIRDVNQSRDIEIEFEDTHLDIFEKEILDASWIESYTIVHKKIRLRLIDLDEGRQKIFEVISALNLKVKRLIIFEPTLEDIFMKVVSHDV